MAEEKRENKFISMLERKGLVRKAEFGDDDFVEETLPVTDDKGNRQQYRNDVRILTDLSGESSSQTSRMSAQPDPGVTVPLFPNEFSSQITQTQQEVPDWLNQSPPDKTAEPQKAPDPTPIQKESISEPIKREEPTIMSNERTQSLPETQSFIDTGAVVAQEPAPEVVVPDSNDVNAEASARNNLFAWIDSEAATEEQPAEDNYTERYLNIEELYEVLALRSKKTDTIYLIEEYIKSIPDSLPDESRRQIISKIVAASGFDFDLLMGDGILRVKMLKEYAEKFARYTEDYVEARQNELSELENQIENINKLIENRRELHKKQFLSLEAEAGRLREILAFINP